MKIFRFIISLFFKFFIKLQNYNCEISGNCFFYKVGLKNFGENMLEFKDCSVIKTIINTEGQGNVINNYGVLRKCNLHICGNNNLLIISKGVSILNVKLVIRGNNCKVVIGEESTFGSGYLICMGEGNEIIIGYDCQIADDVSIWATDSHPIIDINGEIYNNSKPIYIQNHVWIGNKSIILKGVSIGNNSVIGMGSVVTKNIDSHSLYVGNPAKKIKAIQTWNRNFITK